jgi:hypothetical protein
VNQLTRIVKRRKLLEHVNGMSNILDSNNGSIIKSMSKILRSNSVTQSSIARPATSSGRNVSNVSDAPNMVQDILELLIDNNT